MDIRGFVVSPIGSNCYVLAERAEPGAKAVIIDPGDTGLSLVFDYISENRYDVVAVWNTHAHFDHVMGVDIVRNRYNVEAYVHAADLPLWDELQTVTSQWLGQTVDPLRAPDHFWSDGDVVALGDTEWKILHTPGHSPGSVCIVGQEVAFTGDTLFAGSIGRTDFPLSSPADMQHSLRALMELPDALRIYPGHMVASTIGKERISNPFLADL